MLHADEMQSKATRDRTAAPQQCSLYWLVCDCVCPFLCVCVLTFNAAHKVHQLRIVLYWNVFQYAIYIAASAKPKPKAEAETELETRHNNCHQLCTICTSNVNCLARSALRCPGMQMLAMKISTSSCAWGRCQVLNALIAVIAFPTTSPILLQQLWEF